MKSKFVHIIAGIIFVFVASFSYAQTTNIDSTVTSGNPSSYFIAVGDSLQLSNPLASPVAVKWISSDTKTAEVTQNGMVFGISEGVSTIYIANIDGSISLKWAVQIYNPSIDPNIDTTIVIIPDSIFQQPSLYKILIGETINIQPDVTIALPYTWVTSDKSIATVDQKGNVTGLTLGEATVYMSLQDGSILSKYAIYVYDGNTTIPGDSGVIVYPQYPQSLYFTVGDTANIYDFIKMSSSSTIDWVSNGVIEPGLNGLFATIADGYTKCVVRSTDSSNYWEESFVIYVNSYKYFDKDSLIGIIGLPVISSLNIQYQNYTAIEKIDSNSIRIVFEKEITDISEITKYLTLNIQNQEAIATQLKATSGLLTITSAIIDPNNNKAIIITTKELIPETVSISVSYNNVALLSNEGTAYKMVNSINNETSSSISALHLVTVSPNITSSSISIKGGDIVSFEILNTIGKTIEKRLVTEKTTTIDVSNFRPGTYIIKLTTSEAQTISKLFIKI